MINITEVPSTIVVNCGYVERISEYGVYAEDMKNELDDAFEGDLEILSSYLDFNMNHCFVVKFKDEIKVGLHRAFSVLYHMEQVQFCGCFSTSNITCMRVTDDYCYFEIDTESG